MSNEKTASTTSVQSLVRLRRRNATCHHCRAFDPGGPECGLGYATEYREDDITKHPAEPCPRPLTIELLLESPRK